MSALDTAPENRVRRGRRERGVLCTRATEDVAGRRFAGERSSGGGRLTLEQRLDSVWEGLHAGGAAECPVCHGRMAAGAPACCGDCGACLT